MSSFAPLPQVFTTGALCYFFLNLCWFPFSMIERTTWCSMITHFYYHSYGIPQLEENVVISRSNHLILQLVTQSHGDLSMWYDYRYHVEARFIFHTCFRLLWKKSSATDCNSYLILSLLPLEKTLPLACILFCISQEPKMSSMHTHIHEYMYIFIQKQTFSFSIINFNIYSPLIHTSRICEFKDSVMLRVWAKA